MYHFYSVSIIFARDLFTAMHQFFFPGFDVQNSCFSNYFSELYFYIFFSKNIFSDFMVISIFIYFSIMVLFQFVFLGFHIGVFSKFFFQNSCFPELYFGNFSCTLWLPVFSWMCFFQNWCFPVFYFSSIAFCQFFPAPSACLPIFPECFPELVFQGLFVQTCILPIFPCTFCLSVFSRICVFFENWCFPVLYIFPQLYFAHLFLRLLLISFSRKCFFSSIGFQCPFFQNCILRICSSTL